MTPRRDRPVFVPPTYPFDRLRPLAAVASAHDGGMVDLSVGTPNDPPPAAVVAALAGSGAERGYPSGVGSARLLEAGREWMTRRFGVVVEDGGIAACVGTKELVAGLPHWLRLREPERDVVLCPEIAYPTYAMGALLAGARPVLVRAGRDGALDLASVAEEDAARALCLWVNSPSNPTGALDDLASAATWGRAHHVPVLSDECYAEFTWDGRPRSILEHGATGVLAVHSISKRSNCAGLRCGLYAGDPELVRYLSELRRHAGFMVPGPVQAAAAVAFDDDDHVAQQRVRYERRLHRFVSILASIGIEARMPAGGFYLWVEAPDLANGGPGGEGGGTLVAALARRDAPSGPPESPAWALTAALAASGGALVSPGDFYGTAGGRFVRIALVAPEERIELVAERLASSLAASGSLRA